MSRLRWIPSLLIPIASTTFAQTTKTDCATGGFTKWLQESKSAGVDSILRQLKTKGFQCLIPAAEQPGTAYRCLGTLPGYSKKVAIYIPSSYLPEKNPVLVHHFMGWVTPPGQSFEATLARYHLGKELQASGANKILVFPESTGHSGAYRPIGTILQGVLNRENQRKPDPGPASLDPMGNLAAVHLFDSAYCGSGDPTGACAGIRNYSLVHPERISSHFLKGTPTDVGTRTVIAKPCGDFPAPCSDLVPVNAAIGHLNIMNQNYSDSLSLH